MLGYDCKKSLPQSSIAINAFTQVKITNSIRKLFSNDS
jgi:hypothetical protein